MVTIQQLLSLYELRVYISNVIETVAMNSFCSRKSCNEKRVGGALHKTNYQCQVVLLKMSEIRGKILQCQTDGCKEKKMAMNEKENSE